MLPLYLLTASKSKQILVELKNGETLNGDLVNCDSWMNLTLKNVIQTSDRGDSFMSIPEIYIRGNHIKYLRLPEETMDYAKEQNILNMEQRNRNQKRRNNNMGNNNYNSNYRKYNSHGGNKNGGYNRHNQHTANHNRL